MTDGLLDFKASNCTMTGKQNGKTKEDGNQW